MAAVEGGASQGAFLITVAVEGDTDIPFAKKLCESAGFTAREPLLDAEGKGGLDGRVPGFAQAGRGSPHLILRDLDRDGPCAPAWIAKNLPRGCGQFFSLRLAVRAIEAWFLADAETAARCLHVTEARIPLAPDDEPDPKLTLVNLGRHSTKKRVREGLVPRPGVSRKAGPDYERWLLEGAEKWSIDRAMARSPSLARAHAALGRLRASWQRSQAG